MTQTDLDAGSITNVATAEATAPSGTLAARVTGHGHRAASAGTHRGQDRGGPPTTTQVGDVLTYTITVSNDGNVTLTGVSVSDAAPGAGAFGLDCSSLPPVLGPG